MITAEEREQALIAALVGSVGPYSATIQGKALAVHIEQWIDEAERRGAEKAWDESRAAGAWKQDNPYREVDR